MLVSVPVSYTDDLVPDNFYALVTLTDEMSAQQAFETEPLLMIPEEYREIVRKESLDPPQVEVKLY